jgi:outer membrane protein OmpA-like peptidoglycan-associated protein
MERSLFPALILFAAVAMAPAAHAATQQQAESLINAAEQLRAAEFSPAHYAKAQKAMAEAKALATSPGDAEQASKDIDTAAAEAKQAVDTAQLVSTRFSDLVEARDRMELAGAKNRADLLQRGELDFSHVVAAVEDGDIKKAARNAKIAMGTIYAAQVVAARRQFADPLAHTIADARHASARTFAPKAIGNAIAAQKELSLLVRNTPNAQPQAYALSQHGSEEAMRAKRIAELGHEFDRDPAAIERWMDSEDARMRTLGDALGIQLSRTQTPAQQAALLNQAVQDMKANAQGRLADADAQIKELSQQLTQSKGELSDLAEIRHKLELKREAEAKIKNLTKLFDPKEVEILLTPDADVILRLNGLNFRSGSAVIPPKSYAILDNVLKSIALFPDRAARIEGHTDSVGADSYNQALSTRRAKAVQAYLISRIGNADGHSFTAVGFGKDKPIAVNDTPEGRAKNRRIDIVLIAPAAAADRPAPASASSGQSPAPVLH